MKKLCLIITVLIKFCTLKAQEQFNLYVHKWPYKVQIQPGLPIGLVLKDSTKYRFEQWKVFSVKPDTLTLILCPEKNAFCGASLPGGHDSLLNIAINSISILKYRIAERDDDDIWIMLYIANACNSINGFIYDMNHLPPFEYAWAIVVIDVIFLVPTIAFTCNYLRKQSVIKYYPDKKGFVVAQAPLPDSKRKQRKTSAATGSL